MQGKSKMKEALVCVLLSVVIHLFFLQVEAENFPDISLKYEVVAVPTFIFLKVITVHEHYSMHATQVPA